MSVMLLRGGLKVAPLGARLPGLIVPKAWATTTVAESYDGPTTVKPFSQIPKIPSLPFFGTGWLYLPFIGKYSLWSLHTSNMKKYREYGPIAYEELNEDLKMVLLSDAGEIAKVYRNEGRLPFRRELQCFVKYREQRKDLYKNGGVLTTNGQEWYEVRSQVQPHMMKPKSIHSYIGAMDEVSRQFIDRMLYTRGKQDLEIPDYMSELYKWALESIGLVALDARLGCIDPVPNQEGLRMINAVSQIFEGLMKMDFGFSTFWKKFPNWSPTYKRFARNMDYFSGKVFKYLEEAQERLKKVPEDHEPTFLEMMISTTKDPRNLNATINDMFFAGIDTTSTAVGFTLYHLARNPEAQEKAHREVKSLLTREGKMTLETLNNARYLKACVKEAMRLNPVAIGNARSLAEDTVLCGYHVPAGTEIFTQQYVMGQLEKYFPEPKKFRPERFLRDGSEEGAAHDPFAFLPFGFGPRSCVGRRIAEQEIWILLARLVERFRVEYPYGEIGMITRAVAVPDRPLRFKFLDR